MRTITMVNGVAYTKDEGETCVMFLHGARPMLGMRNALVPIDRPERFGGWGTAGNRKAYALKFFATA